MSKPKLNFQRFEFKYYLNKNKADKLIPELLNYMEWDEYIKNSEKDYYDVSSLYFDSPDFGCFWDKESGVGIRKKLRIRYYGKKINDETPIFLEIKRKHNTLVIKDRVEMSAGEYNNSNLDKKLKNILEKDRGDFLNELLWFKKKNSMRPKVFVLYKRKALVGKKDKKFRVTFDYDIKTKKSSRLNHEENNMEDIYPEGVVLELKFNNILPFWFHRIIQKYQLQNLAYSKYCNSLMAVNPHFDDNNYSVV